MVHRLPAVVQVREVLVVRMTHQADVVDRTLAAPAERNPVVVLEPVTLRASAAPLVDEGAAPLVTPVDGAPERSREVTRSVVLRHLLRPGPLCLSVPPCFQPLQLLRNGLLEDQGEVPVGELRGRRAWRRSS